MKYTVEVEYLLPVYQTVVVEADNIEQACATALEEAEGDWDSGEQDYDSCSATYVNGVIKGEHPDVYCGDKALRVPVKHRAKAILKGWHDGNGVTE